MVAIFLFGVNIIPLLVDIAILFCIYLILSLTLNIEFGYTGIPNFGKVFFVAIAGLLAGSLSYRLAIYLLRLRSSDIIADQALLSTQINQNLASNFGLAFLILLFVIVTGAFLGGLFGFLASYPAIRLREDYLAMLLLAAGEFLNVFVQSYYPITGGTEGLLIPDPLSFGVKEGIRDYLVFSLAAIFAVAVFIISQKIGNSPLGRTLKAIRDNETASSSLGKNNVAIRRNILILGSAISGIAGAIYITWISSISPTTFTRQDFTFVPWFVVILGGAANNVGVAAGTIIYVFVYEILNQLNTSIQASGIINLPNWLNLSYIATIALGIILIVVLMLRPEGLVREKWTKTLSRKELERLKEESRNT